MSRPPKSSVTAAVRVEADEVRGLLVSEKGEIVPQSRTRYPSDPRQAVQSRDPDGLAALVVKQLNELRADEPESEIADVVVTTPGALDESRRTVMRCGRLGVLEPWSLGPFVEERCQVPTRLVNDTHARAIGERMFGSAQGVPVTEHGSVGDFCFVQAGEGVGSAIFIGGRLYEGAGAGGHLGRMILDPAGPFNSNSGARGDLETYSSREWMVRHFLNEQRSELEKHPLESLKEARYYRFREKTSIVEHHLDISTAQWAQALEDGDPLVAHITEDAARSLALGVSALMTLVNPPLIIVGGDLVDEIPFYYERFETYVRRFTWAIPWRRTRLVAAAIGANAQYLGAWHLSRPKG